MSFITKFNFCVFMFNAIMYGLFGYSDWRIAALLVTGSMTLLLALDDIHMEVKKHNG